jgi:hypothetical protein
VPQKEKYAEKVLKEAIFVRKFQELVAGQCYFSQLVLFNLIEERTRIDCYDCLKLWNAWNVTEKGLKGKFVPQHLTFAEKKFFVKPHGSRSVPIESLACVRALSSFISC